MPSHWILARDGVDGVVFDLGVSSMQLDTPERGFSFRYNGPLDMRMGGDGPSAANVVAAAAERSLADIIFQLGEERHSRAVARAIVAARRVRPIVTTAALADIVGGVVHGRPGDIHPATRTFQALRLFVNDELGELVRGLKAVERVLKPGGRLVAVAFHSLEDRIVKSFLTQRSGTGGGSRHLPERVADAATFRAHPPAGGTGRDRVSRQSTIPLGEIACSRTHGRAAAARCSGGIAAAAVDRDVLRGG